jgi:4-hydroxybutyrate dehydrogenase
MGAIRSLNLHHGTLNAVLMPAVLRFNRSVIGAKWDHLQAFFGQAPDVAIEQLNRDIAMPSGLKAMGVTDAMMETVSHEALKDHCHGTNPRMATQTDYLAIMRDSA